MSDEFDPYYAWLGIPPKDQPPNHYRLLGIDLLRPIWTSSKVQPFDKWGMYALIKAGIMLTNLNDS